MRLHRLVPGLVALGLLLGPFAMIPNAPAQAQSLPDRPIPPWVVANRLAEPLTMTGDSHTSLTLNPELANANGRQQVVITLSSAPVSQVMGTTTQRDQGHRIETQQDRVLNRFQRIDPSLKVLAQLRIALNALVVEVDANTLVPLAQNPEVVRINPVLNYERDLTETVPYIGAIPAVQAAAKGGLGVRVAVLDSGIDYTHAKLGGPGTTAVYALAYCGDPAASPNPSDPTCTAHSLPANPLLFPNSKVVGGYDFVGEIWPNGELFPDPNPLDYGGHGTHVADIIGGLPIPNPTTARVQVVHAAPAAPNDDGTLDASISADNDVLGGGVAPGVSLYAYKVCSAVASSCSGMGLLQAMDRAADPNGDGNTADAVDIINLSLGADYGLNFADDLAAAVENLSALGVLTVASAGNSADKPFVIGTPAAAPSALAVAQTELPGTMVGSSSRGPASGAMFPGDGTRMFGQIVKPEIGAPGTSVSAVARSGTGTQPFGGTSGAAPMVTGAAALLVAATNGKLSPAELKARLVNTGETQIFNTPEGLGGMLAPISRIGGGEVRVDRALATQAAAWEQASRLPTLSFGFVDAYAPTMTLTRTVLVRNYSNAVITYTIAPTFRYDDDLDNEAVEIEVPAQISVPANGQATFPVTLTITSTNLDAWSLDIPDSPNSGLNGANGAMLSAFEYDGYLLLVDTAAGAPNSLHMPWHVLPRRSGKLETPTITRLDQTFPIRNTGVGEALVFSYALLGTSPRNETTPGLGENLPDIDLQHVGYATYPVGPGICSDAPGYLLEFAFHNYARQSHANVPGAMTVFLDTDRDGLNDFMIYTYDTVANLTDGRNLTWVYNIRTGDEVAYYHTGHLLQSGTYLMTICDVQLADLDRPEEEGGPLTAPALGQPIEASFGVSDIYFTGTFFDEIGPVNFAPGGERYAALATRGSQVITSLPGNSAARMTIIETGSTTNLAESGVLLITGSAPEGNEARAITVIRPRSFLPFISQ